MEDRVIEFVDHLHEHFVDPVVIQARALHATDAARVQHGDSCRSRGRSISFRAVQMWAVG